MPPPESEEETSMEQIKEEEEREEHQQQQQQPQSQEAIDQNQNPNPNPKPSIPASIASLRSLYLSLTDFLLLYRSLSQTLASISSTLDSHNRPPDTEIEAICRHSSPKLLRKYVVTNLQNPILRSEIPAALALSRDPADLVLAAIGKFYVQGSRAFERGGDVNLINFRRAAIMLLEIYVGAGCPVGDVGLREEVKESAREAAVAWRGRLISEGGVEKASEKDAFGLVLLVGAFGVPPQFKAKDLWGLVKVCGRRKGDVLRKSAILMKKMPGIIKDLITKGMLVEAVDLVCAFRLEENFPPLPLLSSFVEKTCKVGVEERKEVHNQPRPLKELTEKQLAALKSVAKCLKDHKLDANELADLKIDQKITKCENEISKLERKLHDRKVKRKHDDVEQLKTQDNQAKQPRTSAEASHGPLSSSARQTQNHGATAISGSRYAHSGYIANHLPASFEASHELFDRNSREMLTGNAIESAVYRSAVGKSLWESSYPPSHDYTRYSAAVGQGFYQPLVSRQNIYQPPPEPSLYQRPLHSQEFYQQPASSLVTERSIYQFPGVISKQELPKPSHMG